MTQVTNENIDKNRAQDWSLQNTAQYVMTENKEPFLTTKHGFLNMYLPHSNFMKAVILWKCHTKWQREARSRYTIYTILHIQNFLSTEKEIQSLWYVLDKFILVGTHSHSIFGVFTKMYPFILVLLHNWSKDNCSVISNLSPASQKEKIYICPLSLRNLL